MEESENLFLKGFIIGCDIRNNKKVWKIRCNDKNSDFFNKKFDVETYKIELAQSMDVKFKIASFLSKGRQELRAIEVDCFLKQK